MPKRILELTDIQVRNAKPKDQPYKLADGKGLYLLVTPTGGNPALSNLFSILHGMGLKMTIQPDKAATVT